MEIRLPALRLAGRGINVSQYYEPAGGGPAGEALTGIRLCADHGAAWIEEPIAADRPLTEWTALARASSTALAGGENINQLSDFKSSIENSIFRYLQPDVAKWGGVSGIMLKQQASA